ncbi:hypothetical protein JOC75_000538 [Metabacillus crassostreae]|uniref:hypothetical protein n=1 Tax=Metabacillus crassostreae TaxID=929098 RepID=UPI00195A90BE|nr:hypothetical protein [Metabacillus crassostreae]MBM7602568.1 hypothetical protein [Metabacillus crassostreae]
MAERKYELIKAFPREMKNDVMTVVDRMFKASDLDFSDCFKVDFCENQLLIPERIYYHEPSKIQFNSLTKRQQVIAGCLFTRHHNGFVREYNLKRIIPQSNEYHFIIPYLIRLVGEYVFEILQEIKVNLNTINKSKIKEFISDNPQFYNTTVSQVISYWNCYYRSEFPNIKSYVGYEIIDYFNSI